MTLWRENGEWWYACGWCGKEMRWAQVEAHVARCWQRWRREADADMLRLQAEETSLPPPHKEPSDGR